MDDGYEVIKEFECHGVIARKIYPKSTELACPSTDGYNDHKSIERKSIPIMMTRTTTPSEMLLNPKHGYYKTLFFGIQGKFRFFLCKEQGESYFSRGGEIRHDNRGLC